MTVVMRRWRGPGSASRFSRMRVRPSFGNTVVMRCHWLSSNCSVAQLLWMWYCMELRANKVYCVISQHRKKDMRLNACIPAVVYETHS